MLKSYRRRRRLRRIINRHGKYGRTIVRQAVKTKLPVAAACALVEGESAFKNIFGCDLGARSSPPYCHQEVTRKRVKALLHHIGHGGASNGVGLTQLTYPDFIRQAERLGGAHKPWTQCRVGFALLKTYRDAYGARKAYAVYNGGTNPPAVSWAYADAMLARETKWRKRFKQ